MKNKILFGLVAMAIAFALAFNVSISKSNNSSAVSLNMISNTATAQAEGSRWGHVACSYTGSDCLLCDGSYHSGYRGLGQYC